MTLESIQQSKTKAADPVLVELIRNAFPAISNEMSYDLQRTSYNMMIYEVRDYCCGIVDTAGRLMSQNVGGVSHFVSDLGWIIQDVMKSSGKDGFRPGDIIITNHQRVQAQHLNNITIYSPFFYKGELICFPMVRAHWIDVGGMSTGFGSGDPIDAWMEGLQLDQIKIYDSGIPDNKALKIISDNIRFPEASMGDLRSQVAACRLANRRLESLFDKYGLAPVLSSLERVYDAEEAICRLAVDQIPEGRYEAESFYDDRVGRPEGQRPKDPIRIHAVVTVSGSNMTIDFSGCSKERPLGVNTRTFAGGYIAYKALTAPLEPLNEGSFRALNLILPEGTFMMAKYPIYMRGWSIFLPQVVDTVLKALAQAIPDRIPAAHHWNLGGALIFFGTNPKTGERFVGQSIEGGGWGGRPFEDGPSAAVSVCQGDVRNAPAESVELRMPVVINERSLRLDSGSPGKFRSGLGLRIRVTNLAEGRWNLRKQPQEVFPPWGLWGGRSGTCQKKYLKMPGELEFKEVDVSRYLVPVGTVCIDDTATGGGWGSPLDRDVDAVAMDVREGYVSKESAEKDYGVVLKSDGSVEIEATAKQREKLRVEG